MGGRDPQIHKLWSFAKDGITFEAHIFARIDVGDLSVDCFHTAYATEIGQRAFIYGGNTLMEALSGLEFLPLLAVLELLGL